MDTRPQHTRCLLGLGVLLVGVLVLVVAGMATAQEVGRHPPWGRRARARLHAPQNDGGRDQPQRVSGDEARPPRVLWRRFCPNVSGQPLGQEGRLPQIPGAERPDSRDQHQPSLLAEDLCRVAPAAVPTAQRLSGSEGHSAIRRPLLQCDPGKARDRRAGLLPDRSAGDCPAAVAHHGRGGSCLLQ
jgi:hypothetical protein